MMAGVVAPSLALPQDGGGNSFLCGVNWGLTTMRNRAGGRTFPPPFGGRVREGAADMRRRGPSEIQTYDARLSRQAMTPGERALWAQLRGHRFLGLSIRRMFPVGPYTASFAVPALRLLIETDAADGGSPADPARTAHFGRNGYRILRFREADLCADMPGVLRNLAESLTDV